VSPLRPNENSKSSEAEIQMKPSKIDQIAISKTPTSYSRQNHDMLHGIGGGGGGRTLPTPVRPVFRSDEDEDPELPDEVQKMRVTPNEKTKEKKTISHWSTCKAKPLVISVVACIEVVENWRADAVCVIETAVTRARAVEDQNMLIDVS